MQLMRTLYVNDHNARLRVRRGNLVVEQAATSLRIPIETLEAVVLTGRAEVTNDTLGELVKRGIRLAALSKSGRLRFSVSGPTQGNVLLRINQYRAATDESRSLQVARVIVAGKLQNCRRMMRRWAWDARSPIAKAVIEKEIRAIGDRLSGLGSARDGDAVRGIEGDATRRYFKSMTIHLGTGDELLAFPRRSRRPPRDPVNALLSFTYGLLLTEVVGALEAVGLDPQIGFLHRPRPGRPALALDLLEELRPSVADRFAIAALKRGSVSAADFEDREGGAVYLSDDGRRKILDLYDNFRWSEIVHPLVEKPVTRAVLPSIQATLMARFLRDDLPVYACYTMAS